MNQICFDRSGQSQQFYKALPKYHGPATSTQSVWSEYLSSAKTQTSNNKNNSNKVKPLLSPQNISKPLNSDSLRIKTQTVHIPPKQPVAYHLKSLSTDIKSQPQPPIRRRTRQEKMIFQSESQNAPFLIISNKVRDSRRFDTIRKNTLPSLQPESQRSIQSTTPRICDIPLVPIQQVTEIQDSKSQLFLEAEKQFQGDEQESESQNLIQESEKKPNLFTDFIKRKVSILESEEPIMPEKIAEIQNDFEEEFSSTSAMKKLSVKMKFKNAVSQQVSTMLNHKQLKSLFTVIISPEFNQKHEEERQKISDKFEEGNFILGKGITLAQQSDFFRGKSIKQKYQVKHPHKMNNLITNQQNKLATTNKAFQRKVQMIKGTQLTNKDSDQPKQFSMLAKHKKQVVTLQSGQINFDNILPNLMDDSDKITITIINDNLQSTIMQFNKPRFIIHIETMIEDQVAQIISSPPKRVIQHSNSLHSSCKQLKLQSSVTQSILMPKDITNHNPYSMHQNNNEPNEDSNGLDFNQEFSKANLYVRLYYQNRLYKLPKKVSYASHDVVEIEDIFDQYNSFSMFRKSQMVFQTNQEIIKLDKVLELSNLGLQQSIELDKYSVAITKQQFSFDFDNSISLIENNSEKSDSFDQILEEPNQSIQLNKNRPGLQVDENHENRMKNIIQSMKNLSVHSDSGIFVEDVVKNQKQISTGSLIPIKKVKNKFLMTLTIYPIMSILDQQTKNDLLTFEMMEQSKEQIEELIHGDTDTAALSSLDQFYHSAGLRLMISTGIELRYEDILIGRYISWSKMTDVEHQDLLQSTILEIPQQILSSQQSQQSQQSSELLVLQRQKLITMKQYKGRKNLQQRDSLTVIIQPKLKSKQTSNSPDATNLQSKPSSQYTNQLTYNIFTQASTQYLTKPTNQSQQSVRMSSQKNIEDNISHPELSPQSSIKSMRVNGPLDTSNITTQHAQPKIKRSQIIKDSVHENDKNLIKEEIIQLDKKQSHHHKHKSISKIDQKSFSMFSSSLRMRNQALEHFRRQNLPQLQNLEQLIYDNNYQEFLEHLQSVPQMYIDTRLFHNETFLTLAAKIGSKEMVRELIKRGADINIQNDDGNTAVHLAMSYGHHKVADILIGAGAHTSILNKFGKNAWSTL